MTKPLAPTGDHVTGSDVADWTEAFALLANQTVKRGDLKSAVDGLKNPDRLIESAWAELEKRANALGASWPFKLTESRLTKSDALNTDQELMYAYCALLAYSPPDDIDRLMFEQLVHCILRDRFGGAALRVGHPADGRMPKAFQKRLVLYARIAQLKADEIGNPPLSADKDLGLDVVAWYSHSDRRGGDLHFLVQCATGRDWISKTHDIDLTTLMPHLRWGATPVRMMCIPRSVVVDEPRWMRWSRAAGIIFDRSRLTAEFASRVLPVATASALSSRIDALVEA